MLATSPPYTIRSFCPEDLPACRKLYNEGLLGGKLAENDTALDIDDIDSVYMHHSGNHFWVAQTPPGQIVGMIGVQHHEEGRGQIRRLRVAQDFRRRGIGSALLETAVKFCRENQYLKVAMDTFTERESAIEMFRKFGFRHGDTRYFAGKELMYFYLDLYSGPPRPHKEDGGFAGISR
ncbi:MAG TPA: GNAT family N-acetyltransferase [Tepidisphaeraceae bacterium]|jgi:ribosomal protein S18 acetylase RimI-like enzyme|nr:GNAT family N-acetyltransferase [Tepidisphaeraceae bacterium]